VSGASRGFARTERSQRGHAFSSRCRDRERCDAAGERGEVVAADRPRRARHRAQCEPASSSPDDSQGATIPRRCAARPARTRCRATLERSRSASEAASARRVSRLHTRRTPVDTERAGAPTRAKAGGGWPRQGGSETCEEGKSAARRVGEAPSLAGQPAVRLSSGFSIPSQPSNTCAHAAFRLICDGHQAAARTREHGHFCGSSRQVGFSQQCV